MPVPKCKHVGTKLFSKDDFFTFFLVPSCVTVSIRYGDVVDRSSCSANDCQKAGLNRESVSASESRAFCSNMRDVEFRIS